MELKQLGEFALIDMIKKNTIVHQENVVVGIGDDAAVLIPTPQQLQLITTDMLVEGVHFDLRTSSAKQLGYKAIAVNLSDIAAMGGVPKHVVVSIALPSYLAVDFVVNLYEGMKEICYEFGVNIVGGDTVSSPHGLVISVTAMGEAVPEHVQQRSGASAGELIVITGTLGDSGCGLDLLMRGQWQEFAFALPLITRHLLPTPQVKMGPLLASFGSSSMNDISDGLASEVNEIAAASKVGMRIWSEKVPLSPECSQAALLLDKPALDYALYGGEDYQLVFTIPSESFNCLLEKKVDAVLTVVGEVVEQSQGVVLVDKNGVASKLEPRGYNHFR